jgi:hypothetical protein
VISSCEQVLPIAQFFEFFKPFFWTFVRWTGCFGARELSNHAVFAGFQPENRNLKFWKKVRGAQIIALELSQSPKQTKENSKKVYETHFLKWSLFLVNKLKNTLETSANKLAFLLFLLFYELQNPAQTSSKIKP